MLNTDPVMHVCIRMLCLLEGKHTQVRRHSKASPAHPPYRYGGEVVDEELNTKGRMMKTKELQKLAFRAGRLDAQFRKAAVDAGHPYTTRGLIDTGEAALHTSEVAMRNITGRAARFLDASEVSEWAAGIAAIKSDPSIAVHYNLGCI